MTLRSTRAECGRRASLSQLAHGCRLDIAMVGWVRAGNDLVTGKYEGKSQGG